MLRSSADDNNFHDETQFMDCKLFLSRHLLSAFQDLWITCVIFVKKVIENN